MEKIRKLELSDIKDVIALEEAYLHESMGEELLAESIKLPHMYFLVVTTNEKVIGYIGTYIIYEEAELLNFVIHEEYQRKGYGQKLLNQVITEAKSRKAEYLTLEVRVDNTKGINFYQKNGFKIVSTRKKYYFDGTDAYIMQKEI